MHGTIHGILSIDYVYKYKFMQIVIIAILVVVGAGVMWFMSSDKQAAITSTPTPVVRETDTPAPITTDTPVATSPYKDGTYSTTGVYASPAGEEKFDISLTLSNGIITDATFTGYATNPASINNQGRFAQGFTAQVVGKPLNELKLSVVNGASLTTKGFMDVVDTIKQDASQG
jgi:uncharacterized protein with FMN-binding domain